MRSGEPRVHDPLVSVIQLFSAEIELKPDVIPVVRSFCLLLTFTENVPGGEIKRDPDIGKSAIQPEPAQTADFNFLTLYIAC